MLTADGAVFGRDAELRELAATWSRSIAGQPQVVMITGDPGIGKTSLLTEFVRTISPGASWLLSGDESERDIPFGLIDQVLRHTDTAGILVGPHQAGAVLLDVISSVNG